MAKESTKLSDKVTIRLYGPDGKLKKQNIEKKESKILKFFLGFDPISYLLRRGKKR